MPVPPRQDPDVASREMTSRLLDAKRRRGERK
jgi:hypothetical protein